MICRAQLPCPLGSFHRAVAQAEHDQRVGQAGDAEPDAALGDRLLPLLLQRKARDVDDVVHHAHRHRHQIGKLSFVEMGCGVNGARTSRARLIEPSRQAP